MRWINVSTWLTVSTVEEVSCTRPPMGSRAVLMPC